MDLSLNLESKNLWLLYNNQTNLKIKIKDFTAPIVYIKNI